MRVNLSLEREGKGEGGGEGEGRGKELAVSMGDDKKPAEIRPHIEAQILPRMGRAAPFRTGGKSRQKALGTV